MAKLIDEVRADAHSAELLKRDRRIAELERKLHESKARCHTAMESLRVAEARTDFLDTLGPARDPELWERDKRHGGKDYCAIVQMSDWHLAEVVDPRKINGVNEYNEAIAYKRVRRLFTKVPEYFERYAPAAKTLWIHAGGDFASGYIHEELMEANTMSPTQEVKWFRELMHDGLATLKKELPGVRIIVITNTGNHGRTTPKNRVSTEAENSFEQLIYWVMADEFRSDPRIDWRVTEGYHNWQTICGRPCRFHHGHKVRYLGGVGGLTIPLRKAISAWNKTQWADADFFCHFHTYIDIGEAVGNGSLIGYGPLSIDMKTDFQHPIQSFIVFDRKYGIRQSTKIFV